jgi:hypothetical protein
MRAASLGFFARRMAAACARSVPSNFAAWKKCSTVGKYAPSISTP